MVVIAIISIMSGVVVVGFQSFSDSVKAQETGAVIGDYLKQLELEIAQSQYEKTTVSFLPDYLMVISHVNDPEIDLEIKGFGLNPCLEGEVVVSISTNGNPAYVTKTDENGDSLEVLVFDENGVICVDFLSAKELNWNFQAHYQSQSSDALRFFHFNLNREDVSDPFKIISGLDYQVEFETPYGQQRLILEDEEVFDEVSLLLENSVEGVEWAL